jgi:hypothetical protein
MAAVREGRRPSGVRVGSPIDDDGDRRFEYRQALRDLLAELTPSAWAEHELADKPPDSLHAIKEQLRERVPGIGFHPVEENSVPLNDGTVARSVVKVTCVTEAVLVVAIDAGNHQAVEIFAACRQLVSREHDIDAVAITVPGGEWSTALYKRSSLRGGYETPGGAFVEPREEPLEFGLVDTLVKHFDGATMVWDVTEPMSGQVNGPSLREVATGHAEDALEQVRREGQRARQTPKKTTWPETPADLVEKAALFIEAVVAEQPLDDALRELGLGDLL